MCQEVLDRTIKSSRFAKSSGLIIMHMRPKRVKSCQDMFVNVQSAFKSLQVSIRNEVFRFDDIRAFASDSCRNVSGSVRSPL